jgi:ribosome-binding factor A
MQQARDPRVAGVTITGVEVTPDLLLAHVHFSVLGDAQEQKEALAGLEHARGFLRTELAARVQLRFVPDLDFRLDKSAAYGQRIDELLDQLKETDGADHESWGGEQEPG